VDQGSPYQFNANDIRRYFEGKMTPSEKHALESAALDDPFLADAMEGFEMTTPAVAGADLSSLKAKLDQRVHPVNAVPNQTKQSLSIAAATIVVLGSAVALWLATGSPEPKAMAKLEEPKV
jgi:hypothetical protein